jgi:hypothetical protein
MVRLSLAGPGFCLPSVTSRYLLNPRSVEHSRSVTQPFHDLASPMLYALVVANDLPTLLQGLTVHDDCTMMMRPRLDERKAREP